MCDNYLDVLQNNFRLKANQQPFHASVSGNKRETFNAGAFYVNWT